jgi:hypothetical protein
MGVSNPTDFDHHVESLRLLTEDMTEHTNIVDSLNRELQEVFPLDLKNEITKHCLNYEKIPNQVNIFVITRLWSLAKAFDLVGYGKMRYNLIGNGGHWFPGVQYEEAFKKDIEATLKNLKYKTEILDILDECVDLFKGEEQKRLSES